MEEKIAILGLGYVGLPVAIALSGKNAGVIGFDINLTRITALKKGIDATCEVNQQVLNTAPLTLTHNPNDLKTANFFIVTVPTPIDRHRRPDLSAIESACLMLGKVLKKDDIVVFESTVYPGVTEDFCGPILEKASGLKSGSDFFLGYSPERINPGDKEHRLETITKIISAQTPEALQRIKNVYGSVVTAGLYEAPSIKIAEAAKVIENTQRDLNIALMNELSVIFHRLGLRTQDVLAAAGTKWNFLKFTPGLVGGHCIGVDPYYLTTLAEQIGYHPHVILAGRRINDSMGGYIADQTIKQIMAANVPLKDAKIGIWGLTFKEDVPDLRNTRVVDIDHALREFGLKPLIHDAMAAADDALHEYNITLAPLDEFQDLNALIIAVPHQAYREIKLAEVLARLKPGGVLVDVKSIFDPRDVPDTYQYWSL